MLKSTIGTHSFAISKKHVGVMRRLDFFFKICSFRSDLQIFS